MQTVRMKEVNMSTNANKELLRHYHDAWSKGDLEQLRHMLDDNCVTHNLATGEERGVDFETEACAIWHQSFGDVQVHIQQMVAEGDKVTVHWLLTSTHTGDFMGIEATQKPVHVPGMEINRVMDGRIAEIWRLSDTMSLMQQLGAV